MAGLLARGLIAICVCFAAAPTRAQDAAAPPRIALSGAGIAATTLTPDSLARLAAIERDVAFATSGGERRGRYRGVLLWTVLDAAGLTRGTERHAELRRTFTVTGRDGYAVAFSVGEIAPDFGNAPAMIALSVDGGPLPVGEGLRLIVPGDRRGARAVRDVASIELR